MKRPHLAYHLRIGLKETYLQRKARRQKIHVPLHLIETGSADEIIGLFTICPHCGTQRLPDNLLAQAIEMANTADQFIALHDAFEATLPDDNHSIAQ